MDTPDLVEASRALARSEIWVEKIEGGYRLVVESDLVTFRSSPFLSRTDAEGARRVIEEFAEWSSASKSLIAEAVENSGPKTKEELEDQVRREAEKRVSDQPPDQERVVSKGEQAHAATDEESDTFGSGAIQDTREQNSERKKAESGEKELATPEWRRKEVQKLLRAFSRLQS